MAPPNRITRSRLWCRARRRYEVLRAHMPAGRLHPRAHRSMGPMAGYLVPQIELGELSLLPAGSLGHAYYTHMTRNRFKPFRVDARLHEQIRRCVFAVRYRVVHDVLHVLTGFDTSYAGEVGVLAFAVAQRYSRAQRMEFYAACTAAPLLAPLQIASVVRNACRGRALGHRVRFLLNYRFEEDWGRQLYDVRTELGFTTAADHALASSNA